MVNAVISNAGDVPTLRVGSRISSDFLTSDCSNSVASIWWLAYLPNGWMAEVTSPVWLAPATAGNFCGFESALVEVRPSIVAGYWAEHRGWWALMSFLQTRFWKSLPSGEYWKTRLHARVCCDQPDRPQSSPKFLESAHGFRTSWGCRKDRVGATCPSQ